MTLSPNEIEALWLSLRVAGIGSFVALPFAITLGILMARVEFRGKFIVNNLIHLPMVLPPVVVGYLLLVLLSRQGAIGGLFYDYLGIEIAFTWRAAAVASAVMGFPLMVRAIRISIEAIDPETEASARILGAGRIKLLWKVTLPLALPGIIAGLMMGFGRALGEFGATMIVAANIPSKTQTIPLALYNALQQPDGEWAVLRYTLIALAIAAIAIALSEFALRFFSKKRAPH